MKISLHLFLSVSDSYALFLLLSPIPPFPLLCYENQFVLDHVQGGFGMISQNLMAPAALFVALRDFNK